MKLQKVIFSLLMAIIVIAVVIFGNSTQNITKNSNFPKIGKEEFKRATVVEIKEEGTIPVSKKNNPYQIVLVELKEGSNKGQRTEIYYGGQITLTKDQLLKKGETVVTREISQKEERKYIIYDKYRANTLIFLVLGFLAVVIILVGKKGIGSIIGMGISLLIILFFIVPRILSGNDPLFISIIGALIIMTSTIYLAHGVSQKTTVALVSTLLSLILAGFLAVLFVNIAKLSGLGSENAYNLQLGFQATINLKGLLLGGIIIGALGVLDDITTTQTATIYTLAQTDKKLTIKKLTEKGFSIGKEHIASLVNTLVLAYAGASIGIFIFIILTTQQGMPWWIILNSEQIAEEIIRTLAGSLGLILAVPITTILASFFARYDLKID